jgi:uncharacterized protein (DUF1697 family)
MSERYQSQNEHLDRLAQSEMRTYIQSGNILFGVSKRIATVLAVEIASTINARFGHRESMTDDNGKALH